MFWTAGLCKLEDRLRALYVHGPKVVRVSDVTNIRGCVVNEIDFSTKLPVFVWRDAEFRRLEVTGNRLDPGA